MVKMRATNNSVSRVSSWEVSVLSVHVLTNASCKKVSEDSQSLPKPAEPHAIIDSKQIHHSLQKRHSFVFMHRTGQTILLPAHGI